MRIVLKKSVTFTELGGAGSFLAMALLVSGLVVYGFSRTLDQRLFQPPNLMPPIQSVHAAIVYGRLVQSWG